MTIKKLDTAITGSDFRELSFQLLRRENYLPDCLRDIKRFTEQWEWVMGRALQPVGIYSNGKLGGFWFLGDVTLGHECTLYLWVWDKSCWTARVVRAISEYVDNGVKECGLCRVVCRTPDEKKYGRMLNQLGFKLESRSRAAWKSVGRLGVLFTFRKLWPYVSGGV